MASLAPSAVTVLSAWTSGGPNGNRNKILQVSVVLSAQGSSTNLIGAAALGFQKILATSNWTASDNSAVAVASVSADGSAILLGETPADVTGTYIGVVEGIRP